MALSTNRFTKMLRYCRNMQFTNRCNGQPQVLPNYNVLLHGASMVQLFYLLMAEYREYNKGSCPFDQMEREVMVRAMLFHDGIEQLTGDVLAPAKWLAPVECDTVEERVHKSIEDDLYSDDLVYTDAIIEEGLDQDEIHVFKFLDMAEYALRLLEEAECGNMHERVRTGLANARRVCKERYNAVDRADIVLFLNPLYRYIMENTCSGED